MNEQLQTQQEPGVPGATGPTDKAVTPKSPADKILSHDDLTIQDSGGNEMNMPQRIVKVKISEIQLLPEQVSTYGANEDRSVLVESIANVGVLRPGAMDSNTKTLVDGAGRLYGAKKCGHTEFPVILIDYASKDEMLEAFLNFNTQRQKTFEQVTREAMLRKEIEARLAKGRQATRSKKQGMETLPEAKTGSARDITAEKFGLSGKTLDKAINVIKAIDQLKAEGKTEDANVLSAALEKSVDGAHKLAKGQAQVAKPKAAAKTKAETMPVPAPASPKGDVQSQESSAKEAGTPEDPAPSKLVFTDSDHAWDVLNDSYAPYLRIKAAGFTPEQRTNWRLLLKQMLNHFTK